MLSLTQHRLDRWQRAQNEKVVDVQIAQLLDLFAALVVGANGRDDVSRRNVLEQCLVLVVHDEQVVVQNGGVGDVHENDDRPDDLGRDVGRWHDLEQVVFLFFVQVAPLAQITLLSKTGTDRRNAESGRYGFDSFRCHARDGGVKDDVRRLVGVQHFRVFCANWVGVREWEGSVRE
jgi:hypothetical protein